MHLTLLTEPKGYSPAAIGVLKALGPVASFKDAKKKRLLKRADILVVKLGMKISKRVMNMMPRLKVIGTSTTGLNHIDLNEAKRRGIAILSLRGETKFLKTIFPTAEETFGLIIMLMRNLHSGFDSIREEKWLKERFYGHELFGKVLGVVGFGRLGSMLARFGRAFGMEVIACDPNVSAKEMRKEKVRKAEIDEIFRRSDIVSVHVLLTPDTLHLIKRRHFKLMKPSAYFINTARGEIIDESALLDALNKKWIAGAALDVLANEDPRGGHIKNHPLVRYAKAHNNLIIVPHLGGATYESMARTEDFIAGKIVRFISRPH